MHLTTMLHHSSRLLSVFGVSKHSFTAILAIVVMFPNFVFLTTVDIGEIILSEGGNATDIFEICFIAGTSEKSCLRDQYRF